MFTTLFAQKYIFFWIYQLKIFFLKIWSTFVEVVKKLKCLFQRHSVRDWLAELWNIMLYSKWLFVSRAAGSIQESMEGKFRKAIEGFENKLVKNIEVEGNSFWTELQARHVLAEEQIDRCKNEVWQLSILKSWKIIILWLVTDYYIVTGYSVFSNMCHCQPQSRPFELHL